MLRRRSPFSSRFLPTDPGAEAITGAARSHAQHLIQQLGELYPYDEYALLPEVRVLGLPCPHDVTRRADAFVVKLTGPLWETEGFEVKTSRADWLRELRDPAKSGPLQAFCSAFWLVVPAPYKNIVHVPELPNRWGLIEAGTGRPQINVEAARRLAEEPTPAFGKELVRRARAVGRVELAHEVGGMPLQSVSRILDRQHVGLVCGHVAPRPLAKGLPGLVPCAACRAGLPGDERIVSAAIRAAEPEEVERFRAELDERCRELGLQSGCNCPRRAGAAEVCVYEQLRALGIEVDEAHKAATKTPCHCDCHARSGGAA